MHFVSWVRQDRSRRFYRTVFRPELKNAHRKFAVFTHHGALSRLAKTYLYLYGTWLPGARYQLDSREDFEVYIRPVVSPDDPANEVKLFIPIQ
ncbi:GyrI-like domain-containing protein [Holdemania filiformis]|uniref:GyrI-like domain-containing protein n=1 Tax=Holdemania filiformis TaxID=61171 RepID=UPI00242CEA11|nr:GyrI-like domain-containing protein [Holdemania filiformis]